MKKKLIEVALPLEAINKESIREQSNPFLIGHPRSLHPWWARRPQAACRAVLFASLVDDPSSNPDKFPTEIAQDHERQRLFRLIEELVKWENSTNRALLDQVHAEILRSTTDKLPIIGDPFCGRGSIPLEAQRLGLEAQGSDLNPIATLITKALIEIPPKFLGKCPVNPSDRARMARPKMWTAALGLAEDVRFYGKWMRDRAFERIGHLYPLIKVPPQLGGGEAKVIAWLWARTVVCPNPACGARMPLIKSLALSSKPGKKAWLEPLVDHGEKRVRFEVRMGNSGEPSDPPKVGRGAKFICLVCRELAPEQHIKDEGMAGRIGVQLIAVVAEGDRGRIYLPATEEQATAADDLSPEAGPEQEIANDPRNLWCVSYGLTRFRDLFTNRQLIALNTFTRLVSEVRQEVLKESNDPEYADALATYLGCSVSKAADYWNSLCSWNSTNTNIRNLFSKQAIPMMWDFAEANPFAPGLSITDFSDNVSEVLTKLQPQIAGRAYQLDARTASQPNQQFVFSTDPPYYDNISYADLSDFFYVWLKRSLSLVYPDLFSTLLVPKTQELVATAYRTRPNGESPEEFFREGFNKSFAAIRANQHPDYPFTVFYAFKQSESAGHQTENDVVGYSSTGWETMLEGLMKADSQITGTWPIRSERASRSVALGTNALASSIVLVCRPRHASAGVTTRKDFISSLKDALPQALRNLQKGNIAPVDLAQAAIGPGMAVFSRYKKVLEIDGSPMRVRTALALINQGLDEVLSELESEFDPDTRWALAWFEQHQFEEGLYGEAEVLATAKALSITHLGNVGILQSRAGKVRLLRREELPATWDPSNVARLTIWEVTQHLILSLDQKGEAETANLKTKIGGIAEIARDLAYRLYTLCERKGWAEEAGYYNSLVVAWPSLASGAFELT